MRLMAKTAVSAISIACAIVSVSPVHAAGDNGTAVPPVSAGTAVPMDPALRNALSGIATVLLADFAGRMASGSSDDFDPGPTLQRAIKGLIESDAVDRLINSALTQSFGAGGDRADGLPPELRAALAIAAKAAMANVRREISREFSNP